MTVTGKGETVTAPLLWAFGRGQAGQTYVFERDGAFYESRVSFYNALGGLDLTMGAQQSQARNIEEAAGRRMDAIGARDCFGCHSTGAVSGGRLHLESHRARRGLRILPRAAGPARGGGARRKCGGGEDAETGRPRRRGDVGTLRALPPHVVADRAERPARRAQRPLPAVPPDQQQVLRHGRRAHLPAPPATIRTVRWKPARRRTMPSAPPATPRRCTPRPAVSPRPTA